MSDQQPEERNVRVTVIVAAIAAVVACGDARPERESLVASGRPAVIQPDEGDQLFLCTAPELTVRINVDSVTTGATHLAMGTAVLTGANMGVHSGEDEIVFIYEGRGRVIMEADTFPAQAGTTMYIPRGITHGFISDAEAPMRFTWVITPPGLEKLFRDRGVSTPDDC
jgi:quercetin dioxygenase-like cupin family protein